MTKKDYINEWDKYWESESEDKRFIYNFIASIYRKYLIKQLLTHFIKKHVRKGSQVLHAGCGSGETDVNIKDYINITAVDFSKKALKRYKEMCGKDSRVILADIFNIPVKDSSYDAVYNLGVMEHFKKKDILTLLQEFDRIIKPNGKLILFWPPEFGVSVIFFKCLVFLSKNILRIKKVKLHPKEISRIESKSYVYCLFKDTNFIIIDYYFGIRDLFTYCVIVAEKKNS